MMNNQMTFGRLIAEARKQMHLSQKELAAKILKEDGEAISPQYLNDIEHDRRNAPSDGLLQQFALVLSIDIVVLYFYAGALAPEDRATPANQEQIVEAYKAFRRKLRAKPDEDGP